MLLSSEVLSLFVLLAGFVIGLGAVTVIDLHGFWEGSPSIGLWLRRERIR